MKEGTQATIWDVVRRFFVCVWVSIKHPIRAMGILAKHLPFTYTTKGYFCGCLSVFCASMAYRSFLVEEFNFCIVWTLLFFFWATLAHMGSENEPSHSQIDALIKLKAVHLLAETMERLNEISIPYNTEVAGTKDVKCTVDVTLGHAPKKGIYENAEHMEALAKHIYDNNGGEGYPVFFICFYLNGMSTDGGAYATCHYREGVCEGYRLTGILPENQNN